MSTKTGKVPMRNSGEAEKSMKMRKEIKIRVPDAQDET